MIMNNVGEDIELDTIDDVVESEKKMMKLMEDIQQSSQSSQSQMESITDTTKGNTSSNIGLNISPIEADINYWDINDIPSKYKLYPEGVQLKARPLKVIDIKKLTSINDDNADTIVNDIIRRCVRGIDVKDLYSADKMYILLWLRANSFRDNKYVVGYSCPKCEQESSYHFDINMVNVDYLSDSYTDNEQFSLSNGDDIHIKLLQIKDETSISSFETKYGEIFSNSGEGVDTELLTISFMIDTINGSHVDDVARYNYILDMDPGDFSTLTTHLAGFNVGIKQYMNVVCEKCGGESHVGVTFHPEFFLPKLKS